MSDLLPADDHHIEDQRPGDERAGDHLGGDSPVLAPPPTLPPPPIDAETTAVMAPIDGQYPSTAWVAPEPGSWEATLPPPAMQSWVAQGPVSAEPPQAAAAVETVTCPECGATASVAVNRRDATDFCARCDYPLFWTPSSVLRGSSAGANDMALRRLPGTVGRATLASRDCPHCAEPNTMTAQLCVRCGLSMFPVAEEPVYIPPPVYVPPPPAYEPPKSHVAWWVWLLLYLVMAATVVLVVLVLTHKIR